MSIKKLALLIPVLVLLAAACNNQKPEVQQNQQADNPPQQQSQTLPANQQPPANPQNQGTVYENQFMKVVIPAGWKATTAIKIVYNGNVEEKSANLAAVNITKGNYILYINVQASQASGVEGGRFAEIAMGAPSADAVVTQQPNPPCGALESHPALLDHPRVDLYVSTQDKKDYCNAPTGNKTVWYFSYITNSNNSYFNYYKNGEAPPFVITMAYNSKDVNKFPSKGSAELNTTLGEMTNIVKSLEIKQH